MISRRTASARAEMGAAPDKLSIIVYSGAFDRVHYALATAAAAAATDRPVTLFFTMEALRALGKDAGWRKIEGADARDAAYRARGVATFEELLAACAALEVRFMVCEMGLRAIGMTAAELRDDLAFEEGGLVTFLNDASAAGAMLFI